MFFNYTTYAEIKHSDQMLQVALLVLTKKSALFLHSIVALCENLFVIWLNWILSWNIICLIPICSL